ncbi:MAG: helix-turn-helix domain-containing protein [Bacteroidetes bacterium]|nr:helix-turn-helix domain-containing protein [Bacteroidota bacterium]
MSSDQDAEHFADGITEEIINALANIDLLKVTSRTSAFYFKGKNIPISQISDQLNVSIILEGSVRLAKDNIRITSQLIQAKEDFHFWSETWDRKLDNIFAVQDEVASTVAEKIRENFGHFEIEENPKKRSIDSGAYTLYLRSKSNFYKFKKEAILKGIEQIKHAIDIDPACPFYHASLAIYYSYLGLMRAMPAHEAFDISRKAAIRAIELDPTDPEANYARGIGYYFFEKDLKQAEHYLNLALKYRPNYTNALLGGSVMDTITGNHDRAITRVKKALELDPINFENRYYYAAALLRIGRYKEALTEVNSMLKQAPYHTNAYCVKGTVLIRLGKYEEAIQHYQSVPVSAEKRLPYYAGIGIAYAIQGKLSEARDFLKQANETGQNLHLAAEENPNVIINIYLGNIDLAFNEIEADIKAKKYYLNFYKENPAFKLLEDDSRYDIFKTVFKNGDFISDAESNNDSGKEAQSEGSPSALLDEKEIEEFHSLLLEHMGTNEPYLDPGLSLRSLADQIYISANKLSWLLNHVIGKNFNEFVNRYRVEAFKAKVKLPENSNITLLGLAYECGFNSKTVFNNSFKKETGLTPKAFLKG